VPRDLTVFGNSLLDTRNLARVGAHTLAQVWRFTRGATVNKEAQLASMMFLAVGLALAGWVVVYISGRLERRPAASQLEKYGERASLSDLPGHASPKSGRLSRRSPRWLPPA
jgi:hypothetical protein